MSHDYNSGWHGLKLTQHDHPIWRIQAMKITATISLICLLASVAFAQNNNVYFAYQIGGSVPAPQEYSITTQFAPLNLSVSTPSQSWLMASLSSTVTPSVLTISVNPLGLPVGTYAGTVNVAASGSNTITFAVTLTVTSPPPPVGQFIVSPTSLTFTTTI